MEAKHSLPQTLEKLKKIIIACGVALILFHMAITLLMSGGRLNSGMGDQVIRWAESGWLLALLACAGLYVYRTRQYPEAGRQIKAALCRVRCPEMAVLLFILVYYTALCIINEVAYPGSFASGHAYLLDMAVSVCLLFPMGLMMGIGKVRRVMDTLLHILVACATAFVLWGLCLLFTGQMVPLPGGQQVGMDKGYHFKLGNNPNISASMCTALGMVCLYRMVMGNKRAKKGYALALIPILLATLYTNSRGHFLALLVVLPLMSFLVIWHKKASASLGPRLVFSIGAAALTAVAFYALRNAVFDLYQALVPAPAASASVPNTAASFSGQVVRSDLTVDTARKKIWHAAVTHIFSSPRAFLLGTPVHLIPETIRQSMESLYGSGTAFVHAHNILLQTGLVMGVPGLAALVTFLVMLLVRCVRVLLGKGKNRMPGAYVFPICLLGIMIVNMVESFLLFFLAFMGCVFFFFSGWVTALDRESNPRRIKE